MSGETRQTRTFSSRFFEAARSTSPLCVGFDPSLETLNHWGLSATASGAHEFGMRMLEVAAPRVAVIKPQSAYYEQFGSAGAAVLEQLVRRARSYGLLVLLDCKRGDIGSTMTAYARAYLTAGADLEVDAITASPYLGPQTLAPLRDAAVAHGKAVFAVVLSSNPEGSELQSAAVSTGRSVADSVADWITQSNSAVLDGGVGPMGAVVGATMGRHATSVLAQLPSSLVLAPGIGAQGGAFEDVRSAFRSAAARTIPTVSREVASSGPDPRRVAESIERLAEEARALHDSARPA